MLSESISMVSVLTSLNSSFFTSLLIFFGRELEGPDSETSGSVEFEDSESEEESSSSEDENELQMLLSLAKKLNKKKKRKKMLLLHIPVLHLL